MCVDRVTHGLLPACVKSCPTGALNFGERDAMQAMANERLEKLKAKFPKAQLLDADSVRTIYLVADDPKKYHKNAVASAAPAGISRKLALRRLLKPGQSLLRNMMPV